MLLSLERQVFVTGLFRPGFPTKILHLFMIFPTTPARKENTISIFSQQKPHNFRRVRKIAKIDY
jgi:hypothetical protein